MEKLLEYVRDGDAPHAAGRITELLDGGAKPEAILNQALIPAMDKVGELFQKGEFYLPEMLVAARAMKKGMEILAPRLAAGGVEPVGKVVIGTVRGDMHDIGKNLVCIVLEGAGFEVVDLGIDVSSARFVEAVAEHKPQALALSALLTTTMVNMEEVVKELSQAGLRDKVKIMIGGAPVNKSFCQEIGADFYDDDLTAGKDYAKSLIGG